MVRVGDRPVTRVATRSARAAPGPTSRRPNAPVPREASTPTAHRESMGRGDGARPTRIAHEVPSNGRPARSTRAQRIRSTATTASPPNGRVVGVRRDSARHRAGRRRHRMRRRRSRTRSARPALRPPGTPHPRNRSDASPARPVPTDPLPSRPPGRPPLPHPTRWSNRRHPGLPRRRPAGAECCRAGAVDARRLAG